MGQRQNQTDIIYGDDCSRGGWDAGKTPKYLYARFSQIIKCPDIPPREYFTPPNDRVFKLTQKIDNPCWWLYQDDNWQVGLRVRDAPADIALYLIDKPFDTGYFWKDFPPPVDEGTVHYSDYRDCVWNGAHDGLGIVTWRLETLKIMEALNMAPAYDLFSEMRPLVDGNKVYKFCRLKDATNIAIEFEAD